MFVPTAAPVRQTEPYLGYRLVQLIGRGAFGEVWRALSPANKPVALKFIHYKNSRAITKELRALQSIRQLQHPHLVKTHQIWADGEHVVVAMELAEGNLLDLLQVSYETTGQPLTAEFACFYLRQAARALDYMNTRQHELNGQRVALRHCDVKPSNMLLFSNLVKVADFTFSVPTTLPMWNYERVGTLHYAAPEVFQGCLSDRTDQFALAVTYCQLRTGKYPFPDPPATFDRTYVRPPPDLSDLSPPEVPVIRRALHQTPQNRWANCTEMMDHLELALGLNQKPKSAR